MGSVALDNIKPGMVLDTDATAGNQTLLAAGVNLTEKHIKLLKAWGVLEVEIKNTSNADINLAEIDAHDPVLVKTIQDQLRPHFQHCDSEHPLIVELIRLKTIDIIESTKN